MAEKNSGMTVIVIVGTAILAGGAWMFAKWNRSQQEEGPDGLAGLTRNLIAGGPLIPSGFGLPEVPDADLPDGLGFPSVDGLTDGFTDGFTDGVMDTIGVVPDQEVTDEIEETAGATWQEMQDVYNDLNSNETTVEDTQDNPIYHESDPDIEDPDSAVDLDFGSSSTSTTSSTTSSSTTDTTSRIYHPDDPAEEDPDAALDLDFSGSFGA